MVPAGVISLGRTESLLMVLTNMGWVKFVDLVRCPVSLGMP